MNYEESKKMATELANQLDLLIGRDQVNIVIFGIAPQMAMHALENYLTIDDLQLNVQGPDSEITALMIKFIKCEAWCYYYSMVDEIAC